jgi:hypothetical protein
MSNGLLNTNAIVDSWINLHPAANKCRNIWLNWFLPAVDELSSIYQNKDNFKNISLQYNWSSTKSSSIWACIVHLRDWDIFCLSSKTNTTFVICTSKF